MPSHTFTRVGLWQQSIDANIASAAAAKAQKVTGEELHASDYQIYAYLQTAQDAAAKRLLDALPESPRDSIQGPSAERRRRRPASMRWRRFPRDGRSNAAPGRTPRSSRREASRFPYVDAMTYVRARPRRRATRSDVTKARAAAIDSSKIRRAPPRQPSEAYWTQQIDIQRRAAAAWLAFAEGRPERRWPKCVPLPTPRTRPKKPPSRQDPSRRLASSSATCSSTNARRAFKEFEATLDKEPNRFRALYGAARAAAAAGNSTAARRYYQGLVKICGKADTPARRELTEARSYLTRRGAP